MTRIDPPLPVETPLGPGWAHFVTNLGLEHHLYWTVALDRDGAFWTLENPDIRMAPNPALGRPRVPIRWRDQWAASAQPREKPAGGE